MSRGVGHRCSSDLMLLWVWCRPAALVLSRSLAWEPPYAAGTALKSKTKQNKTETTSTWRLNTMLLNNQWITEEIKEEIKKYLGTNDKEDTMIQSLGMQQKQF